MIMSVTDQEASTLKHPDAYIWTDTPHTHNPHSTPVESSGIFCSRQKGAVPDITAEHTLNTKLSSASRNTVKVMPHDQEIEIIKNWKRNGGTKYRRNTQSSTYVSTACLPTQQHFFFTAPISLFIAVILQLPVFQCRPVGALPQRFIPLTAYKNVRYSVHKVQVSSFVVLLPAGRQCSSVCLHDCITNTSREEYVATCS